MEGGGQSRLRTPPKLLFKPPQGSPGAPRLTAIPFTPLGGGGGSPQSHQNSSGPPPTSPWNPLGTPEAPPPPDPSPNQPPLGPPFGYLSGIPRPPQDAPQLAAPRPPCPHHVVAGRHVAEMLGQQPAGLLHSPVRSRVQRGPPVLVPHIGVVACLQQQPVGLGWGLRGETVGPPPPRASQTP